MEVAEREVSLARRLEKPLAAIMVDLDNFKQINDTYGHPAGDAVLRRFAEIAGAILRGNDMMSRIGGDEFALVLPAVELAGAMIVAEKLRRGVAEDSVEGQPVFGISVGVSAIGSLDKGLGDLLNRTDKALYRSKAAGRNRVTAALDGERIETPPRGIAQAT